MLLVVDIGNTNTTLGVFDGENLINTFSFSSDTKKTEDEYGIMLLSVLNHNHLADKIKGAMVSSVVPQLCEIFKNAIKKYLDIEPVSLSYKSKMPIKLALKNNKEIGADRIANASAVCYKYKLPAIVIDFGTATTFDIVDVDKSFIGGIIAPGLKIQAKALSQFTSKLPKLKIETPKSAIGVDTISAMLSGIVLGHGAMIEGMIKKCEAELGKKATVVVTGGYSPILFENMENVFNYIDKDLTLYGLKELYDLNKE